MKQFIWWRRFHSTQKLPKKYLFQGASELLQRIEFGEYEFNTLGHEIYLEDAIYQQKLKDVLKESPWLQGESLNEYMEYDRKQLNKRKTLMMKNHLEAETKLLDKLSKDLALEFNLTLNKVQDIMENFEGTTRELYFKCMSVANNQEINPIKKQRFIQPQLQHILKPKEQQYYSLWQTVIKEHKFEYRY